MPNDSQMLILCLSYSISPGVNIMLRIDYCTDPNLILEIGSLRYLFCAKKHTNSTFWFMLQVTLPWKNVPWKWGVGGKPIIRIQCVFKNRTSSIFIFTKKTHKFYSLFYSGRNNVILKIGCTQYLFWQKTKQVIYVHILF